MGYNLVKKPCSDQWLLLCYVASPRVAELFRTTKLQLVLKCTIKPFVQRGSL